MKIAVTSTGTSSNSPIDQRFGRAQCFLVHDLEAGEWSVIDNSQDHEAARGAGVQAAQHIVDRNVAAVVTGNCGPKAFAVLKAADIAVYQGFSGTAEDAVAAYKDGSLVPAGRENVEANHGTV
jgi:predicted Fe-Mo cluster-binding NifX family protein